MFVHTGEVNFVCQLCGKQFGHKAAFNAHTRHHSRFTKDHTCEVCGRVLKSEVILKQHMITHQGSKDLQCPICGKQLTSKFILRNHMVLHNADAVKYKCSFCDKEYLTKGTLAQHIKHRHNHVYQCQVCGQRMATNLTLERHMLIHTKEHKHVCNICGNRFSSEYVLNRHMNVHSKEKPHQCKECGKRYTRKSDLKRHTDAVHPEIDFSEQDLSINMLELEKFQTSSNLADFENL